MVVAINRGPQQYVLILRGFHTCGREQGVEGEVLHAVRGQEAPDAIRSQALEETKNKWQTIMDHHENVRYEKGKTGTIHTTPYHATPSVFLVG